MKRAIKNVSAENLKPNDTDIIRWKNTGGGSFRIKRQIIKPGEIFEASPKDISENFRDVLKPIDGLPVGKQGKSAQEKQEPIPGVKPVFKLKPREDEEGFYDVVSVVTTVKDGEKQEKEKALNAKALTKPKAEKLLNALMG